MKSRQKEKVYEFYINYIILSEYLHVLIPIIFNIFIIFQIRCLVRKIKYKDISVDQTKDSNSNTQTFSSQSINQVEIPKIKLRINESIGKPNIKYL